MTLQNQTKNNKIDLPKSYRILPKLTYEILPFFTLKSPRESKREYQLPGGPFPTTTFETM